LQTQRADSIAIGLLSSPTDWCVDRPDKLIHEHGHAGGAFAADKHTTRRPTCGTAGDGVNDPVPIGLGPPSGQDTGVFTPSLAHWTMNQSHAGGRQMAPTAPLLALANLLR